MEEPTTGAFPSLEDVFGGEVVQAVKEMVGGATPYKMAATIHYVLSYRFFFGMLRYFLIAMLLWCLGHLPTTVFMEQVIVRIWLLFIGELSIN